LEILEFLVPLRRWWWLLVLGPVVALLSAYLVLSQQPPIYQAQATVMIGRATKRADLDYTEIYLGEQLANTYADIAKRKPVRHATMESLGLTWLPQYLVRTVANTQLLEIVVTDSDPERARAVADELAEQLKKQGPAGTDSEVMQRQGFVKSQLDSLEQKIEETQTELTGAHDALAGLLSAREIADGQAQILALQDKLASQQANYAALLSNTQEEATNSLTIIETADLPVAPVGPNLPRSLALVGALALAMAVGSAYLLHYLDDTLKSPEDAKAALGLTTLGAVPRIDGLTEQNEILGWSEGNSASAEAYRVLRTNLQFASVGHPVRVLQITSPGPTEGKSTSAANLAVALAQAGRRVIAVDGDLHRPRLHRIFKLPNNIGLTTGLLQEMPDLELLLQPSSVPGLRVLTSGPLPPNPAELLGSEQAKGLLKLLAAQSDIVIVDSPPVLILSDAAVVASQVDGVLLVVEAGKTRRQAAHRAVEALRGVNARLLGLVLNRVPRRGAGNYYYYSYYRSDYSERPPRSGPKPSAGTGAGRRESGPRRKAAASAGVSANAANSPSEPTH
jgi:non-specific protein-tyrosine kinase